MADLMKERRKLSPVRVELSREMSGGKLALQIPEMDPKRVFRLESPFDLIFRIYSERARICFSRKGVPEISGF